jgi:hypothetical protein
LKACRCSSEVSATVLIEPSSRADIGMRPHSVRGCTVIRPAAADLLN